MERDGDDLRITIGFAAMDQYDQVQTLSSLAGESWEFLGGAITGNGANAHAIVINAFVQPMGFWRVHQRP